jgi:hypothetical protein
MGVYRGDYCILYDRVVMYITVNICTVQCTRVRCAVHIRECHALRTGWRVVRCSRPGALHAVGALCLWFLESLLLISMHVHT